MEKRQLKRSNIDNVIHFNNLSIDNINMKDGAFDDMLFYAEKSLMHAQGYLQSDKDKAIALQNKGNCLR